MEITSGIHLIDGIRGANCYLIVAGPKMWLIDTGMPGNGQRIVNYIKRLGKKPPDISEIILTHGDVDHIGSAAEMKKLSGAKLVIHTGDASMLSSRTGLKTIGGPLGIVFKLATPFMRFQTAEPDFIVRENSEINGLRVIHTPGHTGGSISLYLPKKVIFVGDALRSDSRGNPKPPSRILSADIEQAKASLTKISELEFDILLPGHGAPVTGRASDKVKELARRTN
jgi:hydroxyacylglutathione hydrolase